MRFWAHRALFVVLALAATAATQAQQNQAQTHVRSSGAYAGSGLDPRQKSGEAQSLTSDERLAILGAALDLRHYADRGSDCSHFVHALYEHAGFPYTYASSSDLYVGVDEFQRVKTPQAGDLVVWRGHAGVVTNPARHSFFSVLSSGPAVDSYDSRYWKHRGHPRFFRYVKTGPAFRSSLLRTPDDY